MSISGFYIGDYPLFLLNSSHNRAILYIRGRDERGQSTSEIVSKLFVIDSMNKDSYESQLIISHSAWNQILLNTLNHRVPNL